MLRSTDSQYDDEQPTVGLPNLGDSPVSSSYSELRQVNTTYRYGYLNLNTFEWGTSIHSSTFLFFHNFSIFPSRDWPTNPQLYCIGQYPAFASAADAQHWRQHLRTGSAAKGLCSSFYSLYCCVRKVFERFYETRVYKVVFEWSTRKIIIFSC